MEHVARFYIDDTLNCLNRFNGLNQFALRSRRRVPSGMAVVTVKQVVVFQPYLVHKLSMVSHVALHQRVGPVTMS